MITDDHKINWQNITADNIIQTPFGIYPVFKKLFDKRVMLDVYFDGDAHRYSSYIVEVDLKQHTFTLDEIMPRKGHYNLCTGMPFTLTVIYQGVHIAFENHRDSYLRHDQDDYVYIFPFPKKL